MAKGDYPAHLNGDGSLKDDAAQTRRHWMAVFSGAVSGIWNGIPKLLQNAILVAASAYIAVHAHDYFTDKKEPGQEAVYWDQDELQKVIKDGITAGTKRMEAKMDRVAEQMEAVTNVLDKDKRLQVRDQMARYDKRRDSNEAK